MRIYYRIALVLIFAEALFAAASLHPQTASSATGTALALPEIAAGFTYINSNAPVDGCGCFGVYGGSLTQLRFLSRADPWPLLEMSLLEAAQASRRIVITSRSGHSQPVRATHQLCAGDATILSRRPPPALPTLHRIWWMVQVHRYRTHRRLSRRTWAAASIWT